MHDQIEPLTLNAWPAMQTLVRDGWLLRFANGYTKRANSVNPLYEGYEPPDAKIALCEQLYSRQGLDTIFKITPYVFPGDLDRQLEEKGYTVVDPSSVRTVSLEHVQPPALRSVSLESSWNSSWFESFCTFTELDGKHRLSAERMLSNLLLPAAFATVRNSEGVEVACGFAVIEGAYVGLYDVATSPAFRNRGFGEQLVLHLLDWGKANGVKNAYLLVVANNAPAIRLYDKIGFREVYRYWYRVKKHK